MLFLASLIKDIAMIQNFKTKEQRTKRRVVFVLLCFLNQTN